MITPPHQLNLPLRGAGSASRRLYTLKKSEVTAARVKGAARHILHRSGGAPAYISAGRIEAITGLSERTVRRYLAPALASLREAGEILLDEPTGRGYLARSPDWQAIADAHGDVFQPARFRRSPWLNRAQRIKMMHGDRMAAARQKPTPPPCQNLQPHIGRDKSIKKQRRHAPAMTILAAKIVSRTPLPESKRFQIDQGQWRAMAAEALSAGHCRIDVARWLSKACQTLDAAISDRLSHRPKAYLWGIWRGFMITAKPLGRERIDSRRREFWLTEKAKMLEFAAANGAFLDPKSTAAALSYIERKSQIGR